MPSSRILIFGCGELAWGKPSTSPLFGRQWTRGRLPDGVCFGPDGPIAGEAPGLDWVTLAAELDRQVAWQPDEALGPSPTITLSRGEPARAPVLPVWPELARLQAHWATRELGGAGVLVAPREWLDLVQGRQLLEAWAAEGWSWAALEEVLAKRGPADVRFICASESWLRVIQPEGGLVFANGPEAHLALKMIPAILDRALELLGAELAGRWKREEESLSGWYLYQQLTQRIVKALRQSWPKVELGGGAFFHISKEGRMIVDTRGTSGILFRFSSAEAQIRYESLSALRITVELPASPVQWWDQVTRPGFLRRAAGVSHPGFRWDDRKVVILEGVEIRELSRYLSDLGLRREEVDPSHLEEALGLGSPIPAHPWETARKAPAEPVEAPRESAGSSFRLSPVDFDFPGFSNRLKEAPDTMTRDVFPELQRHFVGGLSEPSPLWLEAVRDPLLAFTGEGVLESSDGCLIYFGAVTAIGRSMRVVRMENLSQETITLSVQSHDPWLATNWAATGNEVWLDRAGGSVDLELTFCGDSPEQGDLTGMLTLTAESGVGLKKDYSLVVKVSTRMDVPFGVYDFSGSEQLSQHDFGVLGPLASEQQIAAYALSITPVGPHPLQLSFEDLPDWLVFEVEGYRRQGPAKGMFFQHTAPVTVRIEPALNLQSLGPQEARIVLRSDDVRSSYRLLALDFSARIESAEAHVTCPAPALVLTVPREIEGVEIPLANWGQTPARLSIASQSDVLEIEEMPEVPAASTSNPGQALLRASIAAHRLTPGHHRLDLSLEIDNGRPEVVDIQVHVTVVRIDSVPEALDFGEVHWGERINRTVRFQSSDGRPLDLTPKLRPEVGDDLQVALSKAGSVHVACAPQQRGRTDPFAYEGPGIEVSVEELGFRRDIPVKFRVMPSVKFRLKLPRGRPIWKYIVIVLFCLALVSALVAYLF